MRYLGSIRQQPRRNVAMWALGVTILSVVCASGLAWASSGGDSGHHGFSSTDWYRVMNFAVLFIALFFLLRKPIPRALNSRIQGIRDQLKDLEFRKAAAEKQLADYNQKLGDLEKEAERIMTEYVRQGQEAKLRILKEAESAAEKIQVQTRRNIEHEFQQTQARLQEEILQKALAKAETLLQNKITAQDQDRLVEEYLGKVVAS
jgi:F-type H+-transporting ATPase subunit b